jgi:hypothetical protein
MSSGFVGFTEPDDTEVVPPFRTSDCRFFIAACERLGETSTIYFNNACHRASSRSIAACMPATAMAGGAARNRSA